MRCSEIPERKMNPIGDSLTGSDDDVIENVVQPFHATGYKRKDLTQFRYRGICLCLHNYNIIEQKAFIFLSI